jgi:hypothetical protein
MNPDPVQMPDGSWQALSRTRPGVVHHMTWDEEFLRWNCSCEAGQAGRPCWALRALMALLAEPQWVNDEPI